jgi:hypothetical protein
MRMHHRDAESTEKTQFFNHKENEDDGFNAKTQRNAKDAKK